MYFHILQHDLDAAILPSLYVQVIEERRRRDILFLLLKRFIFGLYSTRLASIYIQFCQPDI